MAAGFSYGESLEIFYQWAAGITRVWHHDFFSRLLHWPWVTTCTEAFALTSAAPAPHSPTWSDVLMHVLSGCLLLAWETPHSHLQKHTVVNCQGWGLSSYCPPPHLLPSLSKKLHSCLWCAGTSVLLLAAADFSLHSSPVSPPDIGRESTSTNALQSALKWFCHSGKNAQQPNCTTSLLLTWVFGDVEKVKVSLIVCAFPWRVCIQLHFLFRIWSEVVLGMLISTLRYSYSVHDEAEERDYFS